MGVAPPPDDGAPARATSGAGGEGPSWTRLLVGNLAVLYGLAAVAISQPMLALFGDNPTFFVAGNYGRRQIVAFAAVITVVPALAVWVVTSLPALAGRQAARVAHGIGVAVLAGLLGLQACRSLGVDATLAAGLVALGVGAGVAVAVDRSTVVRRLLTYLAAANVAFLAIFALASPAAGLLDAEAAVEVDGITIPPLDGPVVVLVLDEFPLQSILRPDGTINEVRTPALAALAAESTWFRNAASESTATFRSVPSILTGNLTDEEALPLYRDHPRNLFTLFGHRYPINRYEVVTDLCPAATCGRQPPKPLRQALTDAWVVFRHRVLPEGLRTDLPPLDQDWGSFGADEAREADAPPASSSSSEERRPDRFDELPEEDRGRRGQLDALARQAELITADPSVNVIHVMVPHHPYYLTPWGLASTNDWVPNAMPEPGEPGYDRAFAELRGQQAMQVGAVDQAVGAVVARLKEVGAWEDATVVLVSDHGVDITPPLFGRRLADDTQDELLRIPLFIKAPGQTAGEVRDEPASTIDVLPSLVDLLGIETDWPMDGHSLFDGSEATAPRLLTSSLEDFLARRAAAATDDPQARDDWWAVVAIGEHGDLVGTEVAEHEVGPPSDLTWSYEEAEALADPVAHGDSAPVGLRGEVAGPPGGAEPPDLVVALDGVISGTIGGYRPAGAAWAFTGLLGPTVEGGAHTVTAYEVRPSPDGVVLHPLP